MPSELHFTVLPASAWKVISNGLGEMPMRLAAPVANEVNRQITSNPCVGCRHAGDVNGWPTCGHPSLSQVGHVAMTGAPVIARRDGECQMRPTEPGHWPPIVPPATPAAPAAAAPAEEASSEAV